MIALFSPKTYIPICLMLKRVSFIVGSIFLPLSLVGGLYLAPADQFQGEVFRLIYLHVPTAFASMALFVVVGVCSLLFWIFHLKVADRIAGSAAILGLVLTVLALGTGSLWGRLTWGTWWVWDARLTSELALFFLYVVYLMVYRAGHQGVVSKRVAALIALIGLVDLPIIHYSVYWWQSLHQGSTLLNLSNQTMPMSMLWPLLCALLTVASMCVWYISRNVLLSTPAYTRSEQ